MMFVDMNHQRPQLTHDMELGKHTSHSYNTRANSGAMITEL